MSCSHGMFMYGTILMAPHAPCVPVSAWTLYEVAFPKGSSFAKLACVLCIAKRLHKKQGRVVHPLLSYARLYCDGTLTQCLLTKHN